MFKQDSSTNHHHITQGEDLKLCKCWFLHHFSKSSRFHVCSITQYYPNWPYMTRNDLITIALYEIKNKFSVHCWLWGLSNSRFSRVAQPDFLLLFKTLWPNIHFQFSFLWKSCESFWQLFMVNVKIYVTVYIL